MEKNKQLPTIITQANTMLPKFARRLSRSNFIEEVSRPQSAELARHIVKRIEVELRRKIDEAIMNDDQKSGKIEILVPWAVDIEFSLPMEPEDSPEADTGCIVLPAFPPWGCQQEAKVGSGKFA